MFFLCHIIPYDIVSTHIYNTSTHAGILSFRDIVKVLRL